MFCFLKYIFKRNTLLILMIGFILVFFLFPIATKAATITVEGFTNSAVQNAINQASAGDIIYLPAGNYNFTGTVSVNKAVTIRGAAQLTNLCVPEYGATIASDNPPTWSSAPSNCYTSNINLHLFSLTANNVRFENLKLTGVVEHETGGGYGILASGTNGHTIIGCEITRHNMGVYFTNSYNNLVKDCFIHRNYRNGSGYGLCVAGPNMATGGASVIVRECEFMLNRHDVASNSPLTSYIVYKCYTHDNDLVQPNCCFDVHGQGGSTFRVAIRDNIFVRTFPILFKAGSSDVSGNYFHSTCGNPAVGGTSTMVEMSTPAHDGAAVSGVLHDIYVGGNINESGRSMAAVLTYNFGGTVRYVTYNFYVDGELWEATHRSYPPRDSSPRPLLGDAYITEPGTSTKVNRIENNTWYDLHAFACDPQGADNIARIGLQIVDKNKYAYTPGNANGVFRPDGNYYIETDGNRVYVRKNEGAGAWAEVPAATEDLYVDSNYFSYVTAGSHRIHFTIRFKVLESGENSNWQIHGYARDAQGNLPHSNLYEGQFGWFMTGNSIIAPVDTGENWTDPYINIIIPERRERPPRPDSRPQEPSWNIHSEELAAWQRDTEELLKNSSRTFTRPNIRRIPDFIDIIISMQDSNYNIYNLPNYPIIRDTTHISPREGYRSPYDALMLTLEHLGGPPAE